jgi:hypothetical protein
MIWVEWELTEIWSAYAQLKKPTLLLQKGKERIMHWPEEIVSHRSNFHVVLSEKFNVKKKLYTHTIFGISPMDGWLLWMCLNRPTALHGKPTKKKSHKKTKIHMNKKTRLRRVDTFHTLDCEMWERRNNGPPRPTNATRKQAG